MKIAAVQTPVIRAGSISLEALLDAHLETMEDGSVLAITSKIVALCENNVVDHEALTKEALMQREATWHLSAEHSKYHHHFTITQDTLIAMAGIDESNGDGHYVLWPKDSQATANRIRRYLKQRFGLNRVGVVITDSTSQPLRRGTVGIAIAHSGFNALHDYRKETDLFGRPYGVTMANVSGGLAAAATVAMGEGNERRPLCVLSDLDFVEFQDRGPNEAELQEIHIDMHDDLFAPFLESVNWQKGHGQKD